jgi:hypothetical protein
MVKEMHPEAIKEATSSVLPVWLDAFKFLLNMDPREDVAAPQNWDRLAIRIQIYRVSGSSGPDGCNFRRMLTEDIVVIGPRHPEHVVPSSIEAISPRIP